MKIGKVQLLLFAGICLIFVSAGCSEINQNSLSQQPTTSPTVINTEPEIHPTESKIDVQPTKEVFATLQPDDRTIASFPDYTIHVSFNYLDQKAKINEKIVFLNNSSEKLNNLVLACDPLRYPDAFLLEKLFINGILIDHVQENKNYLSLSLDPELEPREKIEIEIDYLLSIPPIPPAADDKKPGIFGFSSIQTNFVDWYPFIPPLTENGEWIIHDPWFYGEYLVYDLSDFNISIELLNSPPNAEIAASTLPVQHTDTTYSFVSKQARNFVWTLSPSYVIETLDHNGINISTYTFPFHQQAAPHLINEVAKAIDLFSDLFTPYPRQNLSIVEADFLDGMEYDGLFFLSRGFYNLFDYSPKNYLTFIAVHETAHQWWYSTIANDQAMEPWLDEALCTYSELLFYEKYYPELVDWWWDYRVNFYQPEGYVNQSIYEYQGFVPYRNATYLKGAQFLQYIRDTLGDQLFFEFLHEYALTETNKISTSDVFFDILKSYSEIDFQLNSEYLISNK